jgi:hypothetical protein
VIMTEFQSTTHRRLISLTALAPERRDVLKPLSRNRTVAQRGYTRHASGAGRNCSAEKKQEWHQQYNPQHDRERDAQKNTAR